MERRDIVVIGAGPAGSSAAKAAALAGLSPLLVEKDHAPGATNACGGLAGHAYRRALGLPESVVEREISRAVVFVDGEPRSFGRSRPHYIAFRRQQFDSFLAQRAVEAGAELLTGTRAAVLHPATNRLLIGEREVEARIVVFADGPTTLARDAYGIGHRPTSLTRTALFADLEGSYGDGRTIEFHIETNQPPGYFWVFPKRAHVNVGVGGRPVKRAPSLRQRLRGFIARHPDLRDRPTLRTGAGLVPSEPAARLVAHAAMVVGDAAGLVNPMTGGGIAFALLSGQLAGQVAAESLRAGRTDRDALRAYTCCLRRTPHYLWLVAMKCWRRRLEAVEQSRQAAAYALALRRYLAFFHAASLLADLVLASPHKDR